LTINASSCIIPNYNEITSLQKGAPPAFAGEPFVTARGRKEAVFLGKRTVDPVPKEWLRPDEAAIYLGLGRTRMYALLREGIPSVKVGRTRHIRRVDIDEFMQRRLEGVAK
jgi:excisionase family DNA binding protein